MAVVEGWNFPEKHHSKRWKVIVEVSRGGDGGVCVGEPLGPPGGVGRLG